MDNFYDLFMVSPLLLVVLFFVAVLAGFIDSIAGGGGLLTIPARRSMPTLAKVWKKRSAPANCRRAIRR